MKKLIISAILITAFVGAGTFFGLISRKVPENSIGVVFSKIQGFKDTPVIPGKLSWFAGALLPSNVTVYLIPDTTFSRTLSISDDLPNSGTYREYLEQAADFSWTIALNFRYKIRPESLPKLCKSEGLRPESFETYGETIKEKIEGTLVSYFKQYFSTSEDSIIGRPSIESISSDIKMLFAKNFPDIMLLDLTITDMDFPDLDLYYRTKEHYLAILSNQTDKLISDIQITAEEKSTQTIKLELLKRYGELFAKYPSLIDFLAIDSPNVNKLLPEEWN